MHSKSNNTSNFQDNDPQCIFCNIVKKQVPSEIIWEDEQTIAIRDVSPQAPTHVLVLPRCHIPNLSEVKNPHLLGSLFSAAEKVARNERLSKGYRLVVNTGIEGGQTVNHLHIHVLGGRKMDWPPG